jgi:MFS-type transporter involved in bile tolerance (Atg22 family)
MQLPMTRPKFSIRLLLILTAITCCVLTFATQQGNWWYALLVTVLLTNVVCVVLALSWYGLMPFLEKNSSTSQTRDNQDPVI